ncbi:unnamed protein product, partial [Medioppia subpectinata]
MESNAGFARRDQPWTRLTGAPAWDLQPTPLLHEFSGRCRLFVANLPQSVTEDSLRALFSEFGQISDIYIGKGNQFSFIKMDTRVNAENARQQLDGKPLDGRTLRVRLAAHASAIRVTQLPPLVSNELLHLAFSSFGTVERAIVSADDRGRSLCEGIVEFARKSSSLAALKKCHSECLLLSSTPIPVIVTPLESRDEEEGVLEKSLSLHSNDYRMEREIGPRFAEPGGIEWEMARKWKQLAEIETQRKEQLEAEFKDLREGLRQQMEALKVEERTRVLREQLREMENESQKLCAERESRLESERRREEQRRQTEALLRQQEEALLRGRSDADLGSLRRQESELRQQANALQQLLDRQEAALRSMSDVQPDFQSQQQSLPANLAQTGNQFLTSMRSMAPQNNAPPQQQFQPPPQPQYIHQQHQNRGGGMQNSFKRNRRF